MSIFLAGANETRNIAIKALNRWPDGQSNRPLISESNARILGLSGEDDASPVEVQGSETNSTFFCDCYYLDRGKCAGGTRRGSDQPGRSSKRMDEDPYRCISSRRRDPFDAVGARRGLGRA